MYSGTLSGTNHGMTVYHTSEINRCHMGMECNHGIEFLGTSYEKGTVPYHTTGTVPGTENVPEDRLWQHNPCATHLMQCVQAHRGGERALPFSRVQHFGCRPSLRGRGTSCRCSHVPCPPETICIRLQCWLPMSTT